MRLMPSNKNNPYMTVESISHMSTIIHLYPVLLRRGLHSWDHASDRRRSELRLVVLPLIVPLPLREVRGELVRAPANVERQAGEARPGLVEGGLQAPLADVAPGSDACEEGIGSIRRMLTTQADTGFWQLTCRRRCR